VNFTVYGLSKNMDIINSVMDLRVYKKKRYLQLEIGKDFLGKTLLRGIV
jgi:hypothetical protein